MLLLNYFFRLIIALSYIMEFFGFLILLQENNYIFGIIIIAKYIRKLSNFYTKIIIYLPE